MKKNEKVTRVPRQKLNRKVRGATKMLYKDIIFDSKLELFCFKALEEANISFTYNEERVELLSGFRANRVNYMEAIKSKGKTIDFGIYYTVKGEKRYFPGMTYTPDFKIETDSHLIYIETKGMMTDVYPLKRKIFINYLETNAVRHNKEVFFIEPRNQGQVNTMVNKLKTMLKC